MTVAEAREYYRTASGDVSSFCRQVCFAGIAIIWLFNGSSDPNHITLGSDLLLPVGYLIVSLVFDVCQYASQTLIWGIYSRWREHQENIKHDRNTDRKAPAWFNAVPVVLFWGKVAACFYGYAFIFAALLARLHPT